MRNHIQLVRKRFPGVVCLAMAIPWACGQNCRGSQETQTASNEVAETNATWQERYRPVGPLCGLLCAQAALRTLGLDAPPLQEWMEPKNFSGYEGSSARQLRLLLDGHGAKTIALSGMSLNSLRHIRDPVILHTTSFGPGSDYNHWILFLGIDRRGAWICDFPGEPVAVSVAHLQSIWNGTGIIVARERLSLAETMAASVMFDILLPIFGVASVLFILNSRIGRSVFATNNDSAMAICAAGATCLLAIVVRHALLSDGMLRHADAINSVQTRLVSVDTPELKSWRDVEDILSQEPNARLIDSRIYAEYQLGSISGAISCPWVTSRNERQAILRDIDYNTMLIMFCGSENCPFGHSLARRLAVDGFRKLRVYIGGYADWKVQSESARLGDESR